MKLIRYKIFLILIVALGVGFVLPSFGKTVSESILLSWITFAGLYVIESVITLFLVDSKRIVLWSKDEDLGVWFQFAILILVCSTALIGLIFVKQEADLHGATLGHDMMFIASITLAWFVLHLSFVFRYAHLYYGDQNDKYVRHARGFDFPDEVHPDYLDFAYYSFTIGMTFQVSDVTIKTKGLRRLTLIHALFSFLFNTILVALTINEVLGT